MGADSIGSEMAKASHRVRAWGAISLHKLWDTDVAWKQIYLGLE